MNTELKKKELDEFTDSLVDLSLDELKELEQKIVTEANEADKEISVLKFDLPKKNYKETAEAIRMLLNRQTVQWQYTQGLLTMYEFWDVDKQPKKIDYALLDAVLRTLGSMSFTGYNDWKAVVTVNSYFEPLREAYVDATDKVWTVASKHNAILDRLKIFETNTSNIPTVEAAE